MCIRDRKHGALRSFDMTEVPSASTLPPAGGSPMSADENGSNGNGNGADRRVASGDRRKRQSSLMKVAAALPTVESSLEDFISRANSTLIDQGGWGLGEE